MKTINKHNKIITKSLLGVLLFISIFYVSIGVFSYSVVSMYDDKIYPNVYIETHDISGMDIDQVKSYVDKIEEEIRETQVVFSTGEDLYEYKMGDMNISINKEKLLNDILNYQDGLNIVGKIKQIVFSEKKKFTYELSYNENDINNFVTELKTVVDLKKSKERIYRNKEMQVIYEKGKDGFTLDVDKTKDVIIENLYNIFINNRIKLVGDVEPSKQTNISTIDTLISTYSTKFNHYKNSRGDNIRTGARYINGAIIQPGKTFNFFNYAGPYNKKGYVAYGGIIGNGVCQVASTLYNTTLLAGLKVTQRYQHGPQMPYVQGGLDATVASTGGSPTANYKFVNNYKYPIYISAYTKKGTLTIEIWGNSKMTGGKTFKTESVKTGAFSYKTYLVTYKDGKKIKRDFIASSHYSGMLVL